jgi:hypothetical protein
MMHFFHTEMLNLIDDMFRNWFLLHLHRLEVHFDHFSTRSDRLNGIILSFSVRTSEPKDGLVDWPAAIYQIIQDGLRFSQILDMHILLVSTILIVFPISIAFSQLQCLDWIPMTRLPLSWPLAYFADYRFHVRCSPLIRFVSCFLIL